MYTMTKLITRPRLKKMMKFNSALMITSNIDLSAGLVNETIGIGKSLRINKNVSQRIKNWDRRKMHWTLWGVQHCIC